MRVAPARVVVHGGAGFVGRAILRALAADPGLDPVAGVRREPRSPLAAPHRLCDATVRAEVEAAHEGAAYAVNAVLGDAATMLAATRAICDAALAGRLRRIVHVSSIGVYGAAEGHVGEDRRLDASGAGAYAAAKIGCEAIVRDFIAAGGQAVILRPGLVYGPGGEQWMGRLGRMLRAGRLGDLGAAGDGFCNLIHADDLGEAVRAALEAPGAAGQAINLAPVAPDTWNEVLSDWACAIGATPLRRIGGARLRLHGRLLAPPLQVAKLAGARLGLRPGRLPEPIPPSLLALFRQRLVLDSTRAQTLLGLARTPWQEGLASCAAWFAPAAAMATGSRRR